MIRARSEASEGVYGDWKKARRAVGRDPDVQDEAREFRGEQYLQDLVRRDQYAPTDSRDVKEPDIEAAQQFRILDKDLSGYVGTKEVLAFCQRIGLHHEPRFLRDLVLAADRDGDGKMDFEAALCECLTLTLTLALSLTLPLYRTLHVSSGSWKTIAKRLSPT